MKRVARTDVVKAVVMATAILTAGVLDAQTRTTAPSRPAAPSGKGAGTSGREGTGTAGPVPSTAVPKRSPGAGPLVTVQTARGEFIFETYPTEAPKSVEHILELIKRNSYNGQRISRVAPGFVVQFGDPLSRDLSKKALWNTGGSFKIVGVLETSPKRTHTIGAVALAHDGDARRSDSIMYITMREAHELDGKYNVIGHILSGMPILRATQIGDVIKRVSVTP
jgi:cyclophilin family peptidyl-prolyl cis-trans isomerase